MLLAVTKTLRDKTVNRIQKETIVSKIRIDKIVNKILKDKIVKMISIKFQSNKV